MITEIGIVAGEIWHYLDKHNKVLLSEIVSSLNREKDIILMSVGWLAREGYIVLERKDSNFTVFLRKLREEKPVK
ncbi:winged helix-turn-helix domain-containing protein [Candidatus Omnitrophota bacterium]